MCVHCNPMLQEGKDFPKNVTTQHHLAVLLQQDESYVFLAPIWWSQNESTLTKTLFTLEETLRISNPQGN